jgi:tetratricopeptide (TPR) repeat protein
MGLIYKNLRQPARAAGCYEQALGRDLSARTAQEVRVELAECQVRQGQHARTLETLEGCDDQTAHQPEVIALRGECLRGLGRSSEACALVDGALQTNPRSPPLLLLRARLYREAGDTAREADCLDLALQIDPHDYTSRYQLAQAYERLRRPDDAARQQQLAEQTRGDLAERGRLQEEAMKRPGDAAVRRRLADVCRKLGQPDEARRWDAAAEACAAAAPETPSPEK